MRLAKFALLLAVSNLFGVAITPRYTIVDSITLASAAEALTIQNPSTPTRHVVLKAANIYCAVACTVQLERDGTAATATSATINPAGGDMPAATVVAFKSSNVGAGTVLNIATLAAGGAGTFDLTGLEMQTVAATRNYTLRTSSISGAVVLTFIWEEQAF